MKKTVAMMCRGILAALLVAVAWVGMGCEGDGDGGNKSTGTQATTGTTKSTGSAFEGSWTLYDGSATSGTPAWYAHFQADKSFFISDNKDGSGVRVRGSWSESNGKVTAPFTNPGVGDGRVEGTISSNILRMNFIEYWHTPNKVVPYSGIKL